MGCCPHTSTRNFPLISPRHITPPLRRPIRGDQAAFPWQQHDQVFALWKLRSQSWHMRHLPFHTPTLYYLCDPWVSTAKQNAPRGMQLTDLVWQEWVGVCVFWRGTDCIKMLKSSFIFNGSRGLPITGTAGRLWDDLIPGAALFKLLLLIL